MYFLLQYDRSDGQLVSNVEYSEESAKDAHHERLRLELNHFRQKRDIEVVLLQASDLDALKTTHRRYFSTIRSLVDNMGRSAL